MVCGTLVAMISVRSLTKAYGSKTVVDDLNFTVAPGVVTGFLGPNGAGKSTTMRMIVGLDNPTRGTATIDGKTYAEYARPLTKVGTLLDAKWVHPKRSAAAHLKWVAAANGFPKSRVDEVLGLVGLSDVAGKKAGQFSLGMGQRLGLAAAMLGDPEVLILDEPVNGLDPEGIRWVRGFVRNLAAQGRTVLISSHLLSEMAQTADRLIVIGRGKMVSDTTTHEFISSASSSSVVVRTPNLQEFQGALREEGVAFVQERDAEGREVLSISDRDCDWVGQLAWTYQLPLSELTERRASLEDAFMSMTSESVEYHAPAQQTGAPQGLTVPGSGRQGPAPQQTHGAPQGLRAQATATDTERKGR